MNFRGHAYKIFNPSVSVMIMQISLSSELT